mmetsp:Transcript_10027/g.17612  ORF Transcript_10027/g.17612 Transcript_10027/m.17612 type:complete len:87 (+) Transcript_10027:379-639(+)
MAQTARITNTVGNLAMSKSKDVLSTGRYPCAPRTTSTHKNPVPLVHAVWHSFLTNAGRKMLLLVAFPHKAQREREDHCIQGGVKKI